MKLIGYCRVSTDDQSTEIQREKIKAYCEYRGYDLVAIYEENITGTSLEDREQFHKALATLPGCDGMIVCKLDRFARNAKDTLCVLDEHFKGKSLLLLDFDGQTLDTSTSMGKLFITMLAGFAEFERNQIVERTTSGIHHRQAQGKHQGKPPYGYKLVSGVLVEHPEEIVQLIKINNLHHYGYTTKEIVTYLDNRGWLSRSGKSWSYISVYDIVKRLKDGGYQQHPSISSLYNHQQ